MNSKTEAFWTYPLVNKAILLQILNKMVVEGAEFKVEDPDGCHYSVGPTKDVEKVVRAIQNFEESDIEVKFSGQTESIFVEKPQVGAFLISYGTHAPFVGIIKEALKEYTEHRKP